MQPLQARTKKSSSLCTHSAVLQWHGQHIVGAEVGLLVVGLVESSVRITICKQFTQSLVRSIKVSAIINAFKIPAMLMVSPVVATAPAMPASIGILNSRPDSLATDHS